MLINYLLFLILFVTSYVMYTEHTKNYITDNFVQAVKDGNLNYTKYWHCRGAKVKNDIIYDGIKSGNIDVVKYLSTLDININNIALEQATLMNRLDMVHHFHSYSDVDKNNSCLQIACKYGFIDIIYYLDSIGYKLSDELLYIAAKYGHEHIVRFLVRSGIDVRSNNDIALEVSQYQYPNIAIFLINQGSHVELSYFSHGDITHWLVKNNLYDKDKFGTQVYDRYIS